MNRLQRSISLLLIACLSSSPGMVTAAKADNAPGMTEYVDIVLPGASNPGECDVWYALDEPVGSTTAYTSTTGTARDTISLNGSFVPEGGRYDGAFQFNGTSDYIQVNNDNIGSSGFLHGAYSQLLVSFWIKPESFNGNQMLYKQGGSAGGVAVRLEGSQLKAAVRAGSGNSFTTSGIDLADHRDKWVHAALCFDNGDVSFYVNGELKETGKTGTSVQIPSANRGTSLGRSMFNSDAFDDGSNQWYQGMIDDVRVYRINGIPKVKFFGYQETSPIHADYGTIQEDLSLPAAVDVYVNTTQTQSVPVTAWICEDAYHPAPPEGGWAYLFAANLDIDSTNPALDNSDNIKVQVQVNVKDTNGSFNEGLNNAYLTVGQLLKDYAATNDTTAESLLSQVNALISATGVTAGWSSAPAITQATKTGRGSVTGTLLLTGGGNTRSTDVALPIKALGDAVSLQLSDKKNYYISYIEDHVFADYTVAPALRQWVMEEGLDTAVTDGISLRLASTNDQYLMAEDTSLTVDAPKSDTEKTAATFVKTAAIGELPVWKELYGGTEEDFVSFKTSDDNHYIQHGASEDLLMTVATASTQDARNSATFKMTDDQTWPAKDVVGAVYYPSYALNAPQFWKYYDSKIIRRDMEYAQQLGINAYRIWVSYEYWLEDGEYFKTAYDDFLSLADEHGIRIMTSLFEGCDVGWSYGSVNTYSRTYLGSDGGWSIASPSNAICNDPGLWDGPESFVDWFMSNYKDDERHFAIEIYNEPWTPHQNLAKHLTEYIATLQGSVPLTLGTAPAADVSIEYSIKSGMDMIHYHDNFPGAASGFKTRGLNYIEMGTNANLPAFCTEVQWVSGPSGTYNVPHYRNLAPTSNELKESGQWAPFYWTLMVHPAYLQGNRVSANLTNGIFHEDGSVWSLEDANAIMPDADLENLAENDFNPYHDGEYFYRHMFSDSFMDLNAYKWSENEGNWSAAAGKYTGIGITTANNTDFYHFTMKADIEVESGGEAGFLLRAQDGNNGYYAGLTSGGLLKISKLVNGTETALASKQINVPTGAAELKVSLEEHNLTASVDSEAIAISDETFKNGLIGFKAQGSAGSSYDDLLVTASASEGLAPSAPTGLSADRTGNTINLAWVAAAHAASYTVKRSNSATGSFETVGSGITGTAYSDTVADSQQSYYYVVSASNDNGESPDSGIVIARGDNGSDLPGVELVMPGTSDPDKLYAWYRLDEGENSTTAKSSTMGESRDSIDLSGTFISEGKAGGAFRFNGTTDYIQMSENNLSSGFLHDAYTQLLIGFWMKPEVFTAGRYQTIYNQGGTGKGITIHLDGGVLKAAVRTGNSADNNKILSTDLAGWEDQWIHAAVCFNKGSAMLYINGIEMDRLTTTGTAIGPATAASYLGATAHGDSFNYNSNPLAAKSRFYQGMLDDVRIYKAAGKPGYKIQRIEEDFEPITVAYNTPADDIPFPEYPITVSVSDSLSDEITVSEWYSATYAPTEIGEHVFTAVLDPFGDYADTDQLIHILIIVKDENNIYDPVMNAALTKLNKWLNGYRATNSTRSEDVLTDARAAIENGDIAVSWWEGPVITAATKDSRGSIAGSLTLSNNDSTRAIAVNLPIGRLIDEDKPSTLPTEPPDGFLVTYFRSDLSQDGQRDQNLHYAYSRDGIRWYELNNNQSIVDFGHILRDPFIEKGADGKWHLIYTSSNVNPNTGLNVAASTLGYAQSDDLITWIPQGENGRLETEDWFPSDLVINNQAFEDVKHSWAPEWIYDTDDELYYMFWASVLNSSKNTTSFPNTHFYTTTSNWKDFSTAQVMFKMPNGTETSSAIDANVLALQANDVILGRTVREILVERGIAQYDWDGKAYVVYYKDERDGMRNKMTISLDSIDNNADYIANVSQALTPSKTEGPEVFQVGNLWHMIYDYWSHGKFGMKIVDDPLDPDKWASAEEEPGLRIPFRMRHAGITSLENDEIWTLINEFSVAQTYSMATKEDSMTVSGSPVFTSISENTGYLRFDGEDDGFTFALDILDDSPAKHDLYMRSVSTWLRPENLTERQLIYREGNKENGISLVLEDSRLYFSAVQNGEECSVSSVYDDTNAMHHVTAVYNEGTISLYVDGEEKDSCNTGFQPAYYELPSVDGSNTALYQRNPENFAINMNQGPGVVYVGNESDGDASYKGNLGELQVFTVPLFDSDIADIYSAAKEIYDSVLPISDECEVLDVVKPAGAIINGTTITATVDSDVTVQEVEVVVSGGAAWELFGDYECTTSASSLQVNRMDITDGPNAAYIKVTAQNGTDSQVYSIVITRDDGGDPRENGCAIISVMQPENAVLSGTTITAAADSDITVQEVEMAVSDGAVWELFGNYECTTSASALRVNAMDLTDGPNTAYIKVTAENGIDTQIYTLIVIRSYSSVPVTGVSLSPSTLRLTVGNAKALSATVQPTNAANKAISWSSSNSAVAVVDSDGVVTAISWGTAIITVTTIDGGKAAHCTITVTTGSSGDIDSSSGGSSGSVSGTTSTATEVIMPESKSSAIIQAAVVKGKTPVIVISEKLSGVELSGKALLANAEEGHDLLVVNGDMQVFITPRLLTELGITEDTKLTITLTPQTKKVDDRLMEALIKLDPINAELVKNVYSIGIKKDDRTISRTEQPIKVTLDVSDLELSLEQMNCFTGVYYDRGLEAYVQLGGEFSEDGRTFTYHTTYIGNHGVIISSSLIKIKLTIGDNNYMINGEITTHDVAPILRENRTMLPVRAVAEAMGAEVAWNETARTVSITLNGKTVELTPDVPLPNGMGTPTLINDRTFVPIRYIAEQLEANVVWDEETRAVFIYK